MRVLFVGLANCFHPQTRNPATRWLAIFLLLSCCVCDSMNRIVQNASKYVPLRRVSPAFITSSFASRCKSSHSCNRPAPLNSWLPGALFNRPIELPSLKRHCSAQSQSISTAFDHNPADALVENLFSIPEPTRKLHGYWKDRILRLERPTTKNLVKQLIASNPLGFDSGKDVLKKGTLLEYAMQQKALHPDKIILIRVGMYNSPTH